MTLQKFVSISEKNKFEANRLQASKVDPEEDVIAVKEDKIENGSTKSDDENEDSERNNASTQ